MTEHLAFDVVRQYSGFELRRYPAHAVAEVTVRTSFEDAGNRAFRTLFGYISGRNRSRQTLAMTAPVVQGPAAFERISMTAPVVQRPGTGEDEYTVAFVLPASVTAESAPIPESPQISIRTVPASLAAARRFSGRWTRSSYERHLSGLYEAVRAAGLHPVGPPRFARFDPPFKPWFLRHNEVMVDVTETSSDVP